MTIVEALKNLYVAMGGQASDVENISLNADMINALVGVVGGGSSLPAVTSDDNGKVLAVVEGEWDKAEASGGIFAVTTTTEQSGFGNANHKASEILEALNNNQFPILFIRGTSEGVAHTTPATYKSFGERDLQPYAIFTVSGVDVMVNEDYTVTSVSG